MPASEETHAPQALAPAAGDFALDDPGHHIRRIVPAVGPELPPVGRQVGMELGPPGAPPLREAEAVLYRSGVREDPGLLVGPLMEPLDPYARSPRLHGPGKPRPPLLLSTNASRVPDRTSISATSGSVTSIGSRE